MPLLRHTSNPVRREISNVFTEPFRLDYRSLAIFRIMLGSIIFADLLMRCRDFQAFFTDSGIFPRDVVIENSLNQTWSLFYINGTSYFALALVLINFVFALLLIVGYKTRLTALICWILLISVQNQGILHSSGADMLMRLLLFWGLFLPLGARFSIDAALEIKNPYPYSNHLSIATFAMTMQVLYVYWVGAFLKNGEAWVSNYQAVYYALNIDHYATPLGQWVLNNLPYTLEYLTRFVYLIELYGPLLIIAPVFWRIARLPVIYLLILMHIGFVLLLNVGHFPYVSITSLIILLPTSFWDRLKSRINDNKCRDVTIYYDKGCEFCKKTCYILREFLYLPKVNIRPAQDYFIPNNLLTRHDSWVIEDEKGRHYLEWRALTWLFCKSPIYFWLGKPMRVLDKINIGNKIYHYIGDRRIKLGRMTSYFLPWRETSSKESRTVQLFALMCMIIVLQVNLSYLTILNYPSYPVKTVVDVLNLSQKWSMFASTPLSKSVWPIIEGTTENGDVYNIYNYDKYESAPYIKPDQLIEYHANYRWRKYFEFIFKEKNKNYRSPFVKYLCVNWNNYYHSDSDRQVVKVSIKEGFEKTLLDRSKEVSEVREIGYYNCDGTLAKSS